MLSVWLLAAACAEPSRPPQGSWRTVLSPDGVAVSLDAPPARVVASSAGVTEILLALTDRGRIAAVPDHVFTGWATGCGSREEWPDKVLHRYLGEAVLGFQPDLVIAQTYQSPDTTRILRESGVPVICLPEVTDFTTLVSQIKAIGEVLGEDAEAAALVSDLEGRMRALSADHGREGIRVLSYSDYGTGGWTAGVKCSADLMIRIAGMENAGADGGRSGHWQIDKERLIDLDPDVIVVSQDGDGRAAAADLLRADALLSSLSAVKDGRIVALPRALWNSTSHRLLDAAERLAKAVDGVKGR